MMSKIYAGMFRKKNSEMRHMTFVKLDDVPETFLETKKAHQSTAVGKFSFRRDFGRGFFFVCCLKLIRSRFRRENYLV